MKFELKKTQGRARRGSLVFDRGVVETPAFMPVGTYGTVKGMTPEERLKRPVHRSCWGIHSTCGYAQAKTSCANMATYMIL